MKSRLTSLLIATVILFLWSGLTQLLPWGISAVENITTLNNAQVEQLQASNLIQFSPNSLTTDAFDAQFVNKISTYTTPATFSWIVTQPLNTNYTGYFLVEMITQLIVALLLTALLEVTIQLSPNKRILLVLLASAVAGAATYGQLMNWWRLPAAYALGVIANLIIGWVLVAYIVTHFTMPSKESVRS